MAQINYVPKSERGKPASEQAVITIRELTIEELVEVEDAMTVLEKGEIKPKMGTTKLNKFLKSVIGWHNVKDAEGVLIPFDADHKTRLPVKWFNEVCSAINKLLEVSEADERD